LNEQSAGYMAQGHFLASGNVAAIVGTTGPGATNLATGIASCYYDRIPVIAIVGQINRSLNLSVASGTRMVGFQELPHAEIFRPISDISISIRSADDYLANRANMFSNVYRLKGTLCMEILDDVQRQSINSEIEIGSYRRTTSYSSYPTMTIKSDLLILGAGCRDVSDLTLTAIVKSKIPVVLTWGGQHLGPKLIGAKVSLFGTHTPGDGNTLLRHSKNPYIFGASLLQHQAGKQPARLLPLANNLNYVNSSAEECTRFAATFGGRATTYVADAELILRHAEFENSATHHSEPHEEITNEPIATLRTVFNVFRNFGSLVFVDAGATLSWSYQAANDIKFLTQIKMFSSFNLHPMGFSNCALVGGIDATPSNSDSILGIIGDGSVPMNCQEFAWLRSRRAKLVILDNKGYGIIRMTQDDFYEGRHFGSAMKGTASLPDFDVASIARGFGLSCVSYEAKDFSELTAKSFFESTANVLIIKIDPANRVLTDFYQ
jgi:acetolactate synthase-1/2/3 large subunit